MNDPARNPSSGPENFISESLKKVLTYIYLYRIIKVKKAKEEPTMKRLFMVYILTLKDGRQIAVHANNRVEAFDKMQFHFPTETEGHSFREVESHYAGTEVR